jgi:flagellar biogenesis protein FliO
MLIQIIGILLLVIFSYLVVKRFSKNESLVYEEEMSKEELEIIDKSIDD